MVFGVGRELEEPEGSQVQSLLSAFLESLAGRRGVLQIKSHKFRWPQELGRQAEGTKQSVWGWVSWRECSASEQGSPPLSCGCRLPNLPEARNLNFYINS